MFSRQGRGCKEEHKLVLQGVGDGGVEFRAGRAGHLFLSVPVCPCTQHSFEQLLFVSGCIIFLRAASGAQSMLSTVGIHCY